MILSKKNSNTLNRFEKTVSVPETHGEILDVGIEKLISMMRLSENDVFLDLGSGRGKVVQQVFLNSRAKEAVGIELLFDLHDAAKTAAEKIRKEINNRRLTFLCGDFLKTPLPFATVLFINSTCFSQSMLRAIGKIINQTPTIRSVFSTRPITTLERLGFKKTFYIECSWDTALCYVYL